MDHHQINVGVVGGSINNQWASQTHLPVLNEHPNYTLKAIGTSHMESANKSAALYNALPFDDHKKLMRSEDIDLVVISVKVPLHYEIAKDAISEGKDIYCEWPLGKDIQEAEELGKRANQKKIHHAVGLQARQSPEINYLKKALESKEIGKVLSCTMEVATHAKGRITDQRSAYLLKRENGASLLTINGGHALDVLCYLLGDFKEISATTNTNYKEALIRETGKSVIKDTADQIMIHGTLKNDVSVSAYIQAGVYPKFELEIKGEKGVFRLTQPGSVGHVQFGGLKLEKISHQDYSNIDSVVEETHIEEIQVSRKNGKGPKEYIENAYTLFAQDILENKREIPSFNDAVKLHQLLDRVQESAATGRKIKL
jgi:predicted dehydrogenase